MSVYVDASKEYEIPESGQARKVALRNDGYWCHMWADTRAELLAMSKKIGLKESWMQHVGKKSEHFDLTPGRRAAAVKAGAIEKTSWDWANMNTAKDEDFYFGVTS